MINMNIGVLNNCKQAVQLPDDVLADAPKG